MALMQVSLDRAAECLAAQPPKAFFEQLASVSQAIQKVRAGSKGGKEGGDVEQLLEQFRRTIEPEEVGRG